jgi:peptide/nickel transport system permease protein
MPQENLSPGGLFCASTIFILLVVSLAAPLLAPQPFERIDLQHRLEMPSGAHWLGTDELGRDIVSRLLYGGRVSFLVSGTVVIFSLLLGLFIGSLGGYMGGAADQVPMRLADLLLAFPGILLAIGLVAVLGPSLGNVVSALIVIGWVPYARLARGLTLKLRELDYVKAAQALGASPLRILLVHLLPNMLGPMVVQASFGFAAVILAESSLSFLGLGVQLPQPSWGNMLSDGKNHLLDAPHLTVFPGLLITVCVLSFNLLGDLLRDRLDPQMRGTAGAPRGHVDMRSS